jgi:uncharacterized membrane protein
MRRKLFLFLSIILIVVGIIGRVFADRYSYVSADGILHESIWLPLGTLMVMVGVLTLVGVGIVYLVSYYKNR